MALAIVTSPFNVTEKKAAYAGTLSRLPGRDLSAFVGGYKAALLVLFGLCVVAALASLLRGQSTEAVAARRSPPTTAGPSIDAVVVSSVD